MPCKKCELDFKKRQLENSFSKVNFIHGNDDRYKNFNFRFCCIFPGPETVQSFINIKWQEKVISDQNFQKFCF